MNSQQQYDYGWNQKGERFYSLKSGKRQERINMIAALCNGNLMAAFRVNGSCNRIVFEMWLENFLLPTLQPGQLVIMDNAAFDKGGRIQQLIHSCWLSSVVFTSLFTRPKSYREMLVLA